ncbi:hypothetical protein PANI_CDS0011 [Maribacter phage Panino]
MKKVIKVVYELLEAFAILFLAITIMFLGLITFAFIFGNLLN